MPDVPDAMETLLQHVYAGKRCEFDAKNKPVIDALSLCEQIMGATQSNASSKCVVRWEIHNAIFAGQLDLRDGCRCGGGFLPAMEFVNCEFRAGFFADGAKIERLKFENCRFVAVENAELAESAGAREAHADTGTVPTPSQLATEGVEKKSVAANRFEGKEKFLPEARPRSVDTRQRWEPKNRISLRNCRIATELRLENLQPYHPEHKSGVLLVDAFAATIGTNVIVINTTLRAPQGESSAILPEPHYALDLSTSDVGGEVRLMPTVVLEGGLKMRDARIGGTFWANGLRVTDGEDDSSREAIKATGETPRLGLRLDTTKIQGNLMLDIDSDQQARVLNEHRKKQNDEETFNLEKFIEPFRFRSTGSVSIQNAVVDGDMWLSKAIVRKADILMSGLTVRGQLRAYSSFDERLLKMLPLHVKSKTRIPVTVGDILWLNNCHIKSDCILSVKANQIVLSGALLEGGADFDGGADYFQASGVSTAGDLRIALKGMYQCDLEGVKIGGKLDLVDAGFRGKRGTRLNLRSCEVKQSIDLANFVRGPLAVKRWPLSCYRGFHLTEALLITGDETEPSKKIACFLSTGRKARNKQNEECTFLPLLLDGRSEHLHKLNLGKLTKVNKNGSREESFDGDSPLSLDTDTKAREYLRLFCAFVWGDSGSFSLLTDMKDFPTGTVPQTDLLTIPCRPMEKNGEQAWELSSYVRYSNTVYLATFHLTKPGFVEMKHDVPVGQYEDSRAKELLSKFVPPYRIPPEVEGSVENIMQNYRSDFKGWTILSGGQHEVASFEDEARWWLTTLRGLAGMDVLLNGASCKMLKDNAALVWKRTHKVELESFDYEQVETPPGVGLEKEIGTRLEWVRGDVKDPESKWVAGGYFLLTFLSLPVFPMIMLFLAALWKKKESVFRAQPYAQLATVLRERGDDDSARKVEAEKLWQGAVDRAGSTRRGKLWQTYWWRPYGVMFGFGLSPFRALASVIAIWVLGWGCVSMLSSSGMLQANVTKIAPAALIEKRPMKQPSVTRVPPAEPEAGPPVIIVPAGTQGISPINIPCGDAIEPGLYAFELLTPILNLHQESRCEIQSRSDGKNSLNLGSKIVPVPATLTHAAIWEYGKAVYMLAGSVVFSLALLTFSGIARRWEH
jgi:hypothetical protein